MGKYLEIISKHNACHQQADDEIENLQKKVFLVILERGISKRICPSPLWLVS